MLIAKKTSIAKEALLDQGVIKAYRFPNQDASKSPSSSVLLTFEDKLPERVTIAYVSYPVQTHFPSPYRCRSCWKLGHTKNNCNVPESDPRCKRCGSAHESDIFCSRKCVNCGSADHDADSNSCPTFLDAKAVLKIAISENISMKDARHRFDNLFSSKSKLPAPVMPPSQRQSLSHSSTPKDAEFEAMKEEIAALQDSMATVNEVTIPSLKEDIQKVATDLSEVSSKISHFDSRFDTLEKLLRTSLTQPKPTQMQISSPIVHSPMFHQPFPSVSASSVQPLGVINPHFLAQANPSSPYYSSQPHEVPLPFDRIDDPI